MTTGRQSVKWSATFSMNNSAAPPRMGGMGKSSGPIKATVGMSAGLKEWMVISGESPRRLTPLQARKI